ncbi:MAG TPA: DUF2865 domain-containing protein [Xanthobacteraceae bacterium]|jgi:hypothetical protein
MKLLRGLSRAIGAAIILTATAVAQGVPGQQASSPVCVRLEGALATIDGANANSPKGEAISRAEDAIAKQQADLDRTITQAHRSGCAGEGFFALFSGLSPQCGPITAQIQQMRGNLDRMTSDLERLRSGSNDQDSQRRALIGQLAQNNCGSQYTAAAASAGPRGFFDALFGGGTIVSPGGDGAPSGTYHTVCVRACDGYYFPVSYSTVPSRFADDQRTCQRLCPASEVTLYSYRNPGESMDQAVSLNGQPYTALPSAYRYRKELVTDCSCRRPGQSWAEALKNADDSSTLESGDIVVTDKNAKTLSQAPQPLKGTAPAPSGNPNSADANVPASSPTNRTVRTVGPPYLSGQ